MTGFGDFADSGMILGTSESPVSGYYAIRNKLAEAKITVKKVIGNYGTQDAATQAELAQRSFIIDISGGATGELTLKHNETSGEMKFIINTASTTVNVVETVPKDFNSTYAVSAQITHADGTTETQTGSALTIKPGDTVAVIVTNSFEAAPFFTAWSSADNEFS